MLLKSRTIGNFPQQKLPELKFSPLTRSKASGNKTGNIQGQSHVVVYIVSAHCAVGSHCATRCATPSYAVIRDFEVRE